MPSGRYHIVARTGSIRDLEGMLHYEGMPHLTVEEMNEAIGEAVAEEYRESIAR
jgi:hypothetical protein